jgi:hypothetical protein
MARTGCISTRWCFSFMLGLGLGFIWIILVLAHWNRSQLVMLLHSDIISICFFLSKPHRWYNGNRACRECGRGRVKPNDYNIGICYFSAKLAALRSKGKAICKIKFIQNSINTIPSFIIWRQVSKRLQFNTKWAIFQLHVPINSY